jgi:ankyrin repeat protein
MDAFQRRNMLRAGGNAIDGPRPDAHRGLRRLTDASARLIGAAARGDVAAVRDLLNGGADPNAIDGDDWSPLLRAVLGGSVEIVGTLLDAGADVDSRAPDGATALLKATLWRHVAIVRELLRGRSSRSCSSGTRPEVCPCRSSGSRSRDPADAPSVWPPPDEVGDPPRSP